MKRPIFYWSREIFVLERNYRVTSQAGNPCHWREAFILLLERWIREIIFSLIYPWMCAPFIFFTPKGIGLIIFWCVACLCYFLLRCKNTCIKGLINICNLAALYPFNFFTSIYLQIFSGDFSPTKDFCFLLLDFIVLAFV